MHLVGLYTYCRMMHGAYNVKHAICNTQPALQGVGLRVEEMQLRKFHNVTMADTVTLCLV